MEFICFLCFQTYVDAQWEDCLQQEQNPEEEKLALLLLQQP